MSGLDWRKAHTDGKRKVSVLDDADRRDRDAAARWLKRNDKPVKKAKAKRHRLSPSPAQEQA